jgi:hypothetical protein
VHCQKKGKSNPAGIADQHINILNQKRIMSKFEESLSSGVHKQLGALAGAWKGITKTWFEPDVIADESAMEATFRPVLGGRFLMFEYKGTMQEKPLEGMAIYGYDIPNNTFQCAWIDSFHMGTGIMLSSGSAPAPHISVLGSYGGPDIPVPWGWRTVTELQSDDTLVITAYNISPEGAESKATETIFQRVG